MKRDELALDRTLLANERTLMSYIRTSLNELAISFTFIKFFNSAIFLYIGYLLIAAAAITVLIGYKKYRKTVDTINKQRDNLSTANELSND